MLVYNMYCKSTWYIFISVSQFWPCVCTGTNLICVSTKETNRDLKFPSTGSFFFLRMYSLGRRGWSMRGGGVRGGEGGNCSLGRITSVKLGGESSTHHSKTVTNYSSPYNDFWICKYNKKCCLQCTVLILHSFKM